YPAFAEQIKGGVTLKNIANPYVQMMAQNLEINPNEIGLKDPVIRSAMNGLDSNGVPVGKNLVEFGDLLRGDPRWRSTQQAQDKTMSIGNAVLRQWGVIG